MIHKHKQFTILCGFIFAVGPLVAQEPVDALDTTVVETTSAAPAVPAPTTEQRPAAPRPPVVVVENPPEVATTVGTLTPKADLISVDTIAFSELRQFQRTDVINTLSRSAGVSFSTNGGPGTVSSLFIRGQESDHAVVLLNGRRLPAGLAGQYQLEFLDVSTLESVQLHKGAVSSIYGSDALAGALELRTTDARFVENGGISSYVEGGSFDTFRTGGTLTFRDDRLGGVFDVSSISTDNHRPNSEFTNKTLRGNVAYDLTDGVWLDFLGQIQNSEIGVAGSEVNAFAPFPGNELNQNASVLLSPRLTIERDRWDFSTYYSYTGNELTATNTGFNDTFLEQTGHEFESVFTIRPSDSVALSLGSGYYNYVFERTSLTAPSTAPLGFNYGYGSVFAQLDFSLPHEINLQTSFRHDEHDSFSSKGTWSVGANRHFAQSGTTLFGKVATGYKPPSGQEYVFLDASVSPSTLLPEESLTREIGISQEIFHPDTKLTATWFHNDLTNLADSTFNLVTFTLFPSVVEAETEGFEFEFSSQITDQLTGYANYTLLDTEITKGQLGGGFSGGPGDRLPRRPGHTVNTGLVYSNDLISFGGELQGVYDRYDSPNAPRYIKDYTTARFFGNYKVNDKIEIYGRIENAFDERYQYTNGYSAPGFGAFGGCRITFGE
ncbi:MAG: TonB-dependent receptor [Verrucomicrobiales bacterium]|nr:TonB-dependent receptor [Verrucomicrobiales bacterium]